MAEVTKQNTAVLGGGGVEYSLEAASTPIQELIDALEEMQQDGVEHVVMSSGNYRGAQWASVRGTWRWAEDVD